MTASDPLRWLLLATHVPADGSGGGMVRYTVELGRALERRPDVELSLVVRPDARDLGAVLGVPTSRVHVLRGGVLESSLRQRYTNALDALDAPGDFDVIHGTKHLVPRRTSACRLLTVHDFLPLDRPRDFGPAKRRLLPAVYLASARDADALLCVSAATRARLVELLPAVASRAHVVPLALSDALLDATSRPIPALEGRRFVLVVSDPSPRKNLRFLTHLWPAVRARVPDLVLAVAGPAGWGVHDGLPELADLVAGGAAVTLGRVPDAELRWAYESALVVLCPSHLEGFGLPALEARTLGAPLISSPDPALAEAAAGTAEVIRLDDPWGWVDAVVRHAAGPVPARTAIPIRRWDDVAADVVALARGACRG